MTTDVAAAPRLRAATFDDHAAITRLESAHGLLSTPADEWRGVWTGNPLRRRLGNDWPIGWVLEDARGRLVGSVANIPTLYTYQGRDLIAATGRGWVVEPEYRGVALWLMDEYFNQDGVDLFINNTVNAQAQGAFSAFGSERVPVGSWETASYWVTGHQGFAAAALRIKGVPSPGLFSRPVGLALKARDALTSPRFPDPSTAEIAEASGFDDRFNPFWRELVRQNPATLLCVRNRETLAWHFAGALRTGRAWVFTASKHGTMRAYCVLKRQDHPPSGLVRMRLADYQTLDPAEDHLPALLRLALRRCEAEGIHTLEHVGNNLPGTECVDRLAPYRRRLEAWPFFYKAADPALAAALRGPAAWSPSVYDGDASL